MRWTAAVSRGDWLRERLDADWSTRGMHFVVPRGFPAYARIFHPIECDRPVGTGTWQDVDPPSLPQVELQTVRWSQAAAAFGTRMHPLAQYGRLVPGGAGAEVLDSDGWRYFAPEQGNLAAAVLTELAATLATHTGTPDGGIAAIWEGWGGLQSSAGYAELTAADDGQLVEIPPRGGGPGSGFLSYQAATGPRLSFPGRAYVLFEAGIGEFADPGWVDAGLWHSPTWPQSPSILWPDDRAWVLVTEVDFDSTVVAGTPDLIAALEAHPGLEAAQIPRDTDLSRDADEVNRP